MGYTHYYYTAKEIDKESFAKIANDFKKMTPKLQHLGVKLADVDGKNYPVVSPTEIKFNGIEKCGHTKRDLGITWPAKNASGVAKNVVGITETITKGNWFAGAELQTRTCGGDCSHEGFVLSQKRELSEFDLEHYSCPHCNQKQCEHQPKLFFDCTKTAFKPYDLAVNVCLIIAKHYLNDQIHVSSDGDIEEWADAMQMCQHFLEYGNDFRLGSEEDSTPKGTTLKEYNANKELMTSFDKHKKKLERKQNKKIKELDQEFRKIEHDLLERKMTRRAQIKSEIVAEISQLQDEEFGAAKKSIEGMNKIAHYLRKQIQFPNKSLYGRDEDEIEDSYDDECLSAKMFIIRHEPDVFSITIRANCIFNVEDERYFAGETILSLDDTTTLQEAKEYVKKGGGIQGTSYFQKYLEIKEEYDTINAAYKLVDFEDIVRDQWNTYLQENRYSKRQILGKLGLTSKTQNEATFSDIVKVLNRHWFVPNF